jgi:hypothetical protein
MIRAFIAALFFCQLYQSRAQCVVTVVGPLSVSGAPATTMQLSTPFGVAPDGSGGFWITETPSHILRQVFANGTTSIRVGITRYSSYGGDGGPGIAAKLSSPANLANDGAGGVYIADRNNNAVRRLFSNGTIVTLAGSIGGSGVTGTSISTGNNAIASRTFLSFLDSLRPEHCSVCRR